jgi:hypothetical protein
VVDIRKNEILLEWYDPAFEGDAPLKYKIFMRNKSRNFNHWHLVYHPTDITTTRFTVRNLPCGLACQFRVQACNHGGWGEFSPETAYVIPGEKSEVLPPTIRWKRLQQGGPLAILDRLEQHPLQSEEYKVGMRYLVGFCSAQHGFTDSNIALRAVRLIMQALQTFEHDVAIVAYGYALLGWCMVGKSEFKVKNLLVEHALVDLVLQHMHRFRYNGAVVNAITTLRSKMPTYLPAMLANKRVLVAPPSGETDLSVQDVMSDDGSVE